MNERMHEGINGDNDSFLYNQTSIYIKIYIWLFKASAFQWMVHEDSLTLQAASIWNTNLSGRERKSSRKYTSVCLGD